MKVEIFGFTIIAFLFYLDVQKRDYVILKFVFTKTQNRVMAL